MCHLSLTARGNPLFGVPQRLIEASKRSEVKLEEDRCSERE